MIKKQKKAKTPSQAPGQGQYLNVHSFDLSLNATGWAKFIDGAVTFGTFPKSSTTGMARLDLIRSQVLDALGCPDLTGTVPSLVVMEDFATHALSGSKDEICGMAYLVRHILWLTKIDYLLVTPGQLKKFATGKGIGDKSMILKEVLKRWNIDAADDNQADAIVLCYIGAAMAGLWEPTTQPQKDLISDLLKQGRLKINSIC